MTIKIDAKKRIEKLKKVIDYHRYLYHALDRQEISEAALDSLKKELFDLEQKFPGFITSDSPTQRMGGRPLKKFEKVKHSKPMLSFVDAFSEKDINDWLERISKLLTDEEKSKIDFFCELKIDGLAVELIYKQGIFKIGSTRGDGIIGENVTQNLKTIEAVPLKAEKSSKMEEIASLAQAPKRFVVRGEVFIVKKEFQKLNKEQQNKGLPLYANPRNVAAGSIRQLDSKITCQRRLDFYAYDLFTNVSLKTHEEKHQILKTLGFKTIHYNKHCKDLKEVFDFYKYCQKIREKIPYEIDGVVVIINNNKIFEKLGVVGKAARGSIAFKFPLKQAATIIKDIKIQIGRTGVLTPIAILQPVKIGGVTISRATLHNEEEIARLGVKIGDTVIIGRAGDVIPALIKVLPEFRTRREKEFKIPKHCPVCGQEIVKPRGEVVSRCENSKCFARQKRYFEHFISKSAFDFVGLGPKIINQLIDNNLVFSPADLFELKQGDILSLKRFAQKSAENLVRAIQSRKKITLAKFIYALGIKNVGEQTAQDLAKHFGSLDKLKNSSSENLKKIVEIGPVVAQSIYNWFSEKRNSEFLGKIRKAGVKIEDLRFKIKNLRLKGLIFVLTGRLEIMSREQVKEKIRFLGGEISETVSKKTDFVIVGKDPGSLKMEKVKKMGIKIINEKEFLRIIKP